MANTFIAHVFSFCAKTLGSQLLVQMQVPLLLVQTCDISMVWFFTLFSSIAQARLVVRFPSTVGLGLTILRILLLRSEPGCRPGGYTAMSS